MLVVVGVVVSKLDAVKLANAIGDIPQNINFAIRGDIAKTFLSSEGVEFKLGSNVNISDPVNLAEDASKMTVLVECKQS